MIRFRRLATLLFVALAVMPFAAAQGSARPPRSATVAGTGPAARVAPAAAPSGGLLDINAASADQLKTLPGIGDAYAKRIVAGRPYTGKNQLVSRGVLPQATYDKVQTLIIAKQLPK